MSISSMPGTVGFGQFASSCLPKRSSSLRVALEILGVSDRIAVMSVRPGLIKEVVTVDIPRPRTMKSMRDPDFAKCIEKIWGLLRYDVDSALQRNQI